MIDLLSSIVETIGSLISFVINSISSFVSLLTHIPTYVTWLSGVFGYLPSILLPFLVASLSLFVVYLVLGR